MTQFALEHPYLTVFMFFITAEQVGSVIRKMVARTKHTADENKP